MNKRIRPFFVDEIGVDSGIYGGFSFAEMLRRVYAADIERAFLVAVKSSPRCLLGTTYVPYELVVGAVNQHPDCFSGLAGIDPTQRMARVRAESAFIGISGSIQQAKAVQDTKVKAN